MGCILYQCNIDTVCTCMLRSSFHIFDLKELTDHNVAFVLLLVDSKQIFSTI